MTTGTRPNGAFHRSGPNVTRERTDSLPESSEPAISERQPDSALDPGRVSLSERLSVAIGRGTPIRQFAEVGLFIIALMAALYVTRSVCIPLIFALMLYFLLRPAVRALGRLRIPKPIAGGIVLATVLAGLTFAAVELSVPASNWAQRLPTAVRQLEIKSRALRRPVERASQIAQTVERVADVGRSGDVPQVSVAKPSWFDSFLEGASEIVAQLVVTVIAAYFLLLEGDTLLGRLFRMLPDLRERERAGAVINEVELRMSQYLLTVTLINLALGVAMGISLTLIGMPNPWLWAGMAAVLNFVPYLGAAVGIITVALASFVTFPSFSSAILPPAVYLVFTTIEGNIITPMILGRAFRISPLVLFVWLVFWAWLWSVPGAILAVPLLMLLKIVGEQSVVFSPLVRLIRDHH